MTEPVDFSGTFTLLKRLIQAKQETETRLIKAETQIITELVAGGRIQYITVDWKKLEADVCGEKRRVTKDK